MTQSITNAIHGHYQTFNMSINISMGGKQKPYTSKRQTNLDTYQ